MATHDLALEPRLDMSLDDLDDTTLVEMTRRGSTEAYAVIYDRYVYGARRLARHLGQREESDDVISDAFAQVLDLLQRGKGPDRAFRAYLFTTIRHECGRRAKANKRVIPTDDDTQIDSAVPFGGGQLDNFEKSAIRAAYESLPDRWRTVLWHLDVEGRKPGELADVMDLKPNSVSALVYRARSGLRDAYLQQHVSTSDEPAASSCREIRSNIAGVIRRTATKRDQEKVHAHLETCEDCMAVHLDLEEVNREVGDVIAPAALVAAIGGGAALVSVGNGGAVVAHLVAVTKGLLVASTAPVAAAAVTGVAVFSVVSPPQHAAADEVRQVVPPAAVQPVVTVPAAGSAEQRSAGTTTAASTPQTGHADALFTQPVPPATPQTGHADALFTQPVPPASPAATTTSTTPTAPTVTAPTAPPVTAPTVAVGPVEVVLGPDTAKVAAGSVTVSTKPVKDLVKKIAPRTSALLDNALRAPAK